MAWKITFTTLGDLTWMLLFFITHVRNESYANVDYIQNQQIPDNLSQ